MGRQVLFSIILSLVLGLLGPHGAFAERSVPTSSRSVAEVCENILTHDRRSDSDFANSRPGVSRVTISKIEYQDTFYGGTSSFEKSVPRQTNDAIAKSAKRAIVNFGLEGEFSNYRELLRTLRISFNEEEWIRYSEQVFFGFERAKSAEDVRRIFKHIRETTEAIAVPPIRRAHGAADTTHRLAAVDVAEVSVVVKNGIKGFRVSSGSAELVDRIIEFDQTDYFGPPEGKSAKEWVEEIYGTKLKPLVKKKFIKLSKTAQAEGVKKWLVEWAAEENFTEQNLDLMVQQILSEKGLTIKHAYRTWHFSVGVGYSPRLIVQHDVIGGFRRVFLHPTDPAKLIKVLDPELVPGISPELYAKLIQWDIARIKFFNKLANDFMLKKVDPYFTIAPLSFDIAKLERGAYEVLRDDNPSLGDVIGEGEELPDFVKWFIVGLQLYDRPLFELGMQRYGGTFTFGHRIFPDSPTYAIERKNAQRFQHITDRTQLNVFHGLDTGNLVDYDNVRVLTLPTGKRSLRFIDL